MRVNNAESNWLALAAAKGAPLKQMCPSLFFSAYAGIRLLSGLIPDGRAISQLVSCTGPSSTPENLFAVQFIGEACCHRGWDRVTWVPKKGPFAHVDIPGLHLLLLRLFAVLDQDNCLTTTYSAREPQSYLLLGILSYVSSDRICAACQTSPYPSDSSRHERSSSTNRSLRQVIQARRRQLPKEPYSFSVWSVLG